MTTRSVPRAVGLVALLSACSLKPDAVTRPIGAPCEVGIGACRASGVLVADDAGTGVVCNASPKAPTPEVCDLGMNDEDCDGIVNEDCACIPGLSPDQPCGANIGACRPGRQRCVDGQYQSACEGGVGPTEETCDGTDEDCNGIVDDVEGGCPGDGCSPKELALSSTALVETSTVVPPCGAGQCFLDGIHASMSFCITPGSWTQCRFDGVDLNVFDADHGGRGVIEVQFCVSDRLSALLLTLYYGRYPYRKGFPLLSDVERTQGLGPGCFTKYFSPADAQCAAYDLTPTPTADFPPQCTHPGSLALWPCPDGKWAELDPICGAAPFDYDGSPLWLTAEFSDARASASVSLRSIRYFPEQCKCSSQDDCWSHGWPTCAPAHSGASFCSTAEPRCAGVCSDLSATSDQ